MPTRRVSAPDVDFSVLRTEFAFPERFGDAALAEAERAAASPRLPDLDLTDVPFVTVDPEGSRDLDQAVHLSRDGGGFLVRYAIADVAAFVIPGGALDAEVWARTETRYFPDLRVPLHPPVLSEGAASLLPDRVLPAVVWTIALDADAEVTDVRLERARVRSRAQLTYAGVQRDVDAGNPPAGLEPLADLGRLRAARGLARGGIALDLPEQEVHPAEGGGWTLTFRAPLPVERHNAEVSLLTGQCAAALMLAGGLGLLRTLPPADPRDVARLRAAAPTLGIDWPDGATPGQVVAAVDTADPRGAAFVDLAASLLRGAGYTAFDGTPPAQPLHAGVAAPYAHVTAPLRRLPDRATTEVCLALHTGAAVPAWAREALPLLPKQMEAAKGSGVDRAIVDLTEAVVLADRVGEEFDAALVDLDDDGDGGTVVLDDPAVRGRVSGRGLRLGARLRVRLTEADPVKRRIRFAPA